MYKKGNVKKLKVWSLTPHEQEDFFMDSSVSGYKCVYMHRILAKILFKVLFRMGCFICIPVSKPNILSISMKRCMPPCPG